MDAWILQICFSLRVKSLRKPRKWGATFSMPLSQVSVTHIEQDLLYSLNRWWRTPAAAVGTNSRVRFLHPEPTAHDESASTHYGFRGEYTYTDALLYYTLADHIPQIMGQASGILY